MPKQMALLRSRHRNVATATTATHYGFYVPEGERWFLAVVAFYNDTTQNADLKVSIEGHGYDHVIGANQNGVKGLWDFIRPQCWLMPGERLKFYWEDIVSTEVCELHLTGHKQITPRCDVD